MEKLYKFLDFVNEKKDEKKITVIEMTGSPRAMSDFNTKEDFLRELSPLGFEKGKMSKRNNRVDILVTNDIKSKTNKMDLAKELGVKIMTYDEIANKYL